MSLLKPGRWGRLSAAQGGASAIEFALTAPIFFAMLFGIIEAATALHTKNQLFAGIMEASRMLKTGSVHTVAPEDRPAAIIDAVCSSAIIPACQSRLFVQIQVLSDGPMDSMLDVSGVDQTQLIFETGTAEELLGVELAYQLLPGFIGPIFGSEVREDGNVYLTAMTVFRTEPF